MIDFVERIYVRWYNINVGGLCHTSLSGGQRDDV